MDAVADVVVNGSISEILPALVNGPGLQGRVAPHCAV